MNGLVVNFGAIVEGPARLLAEDLRLHMPVVAMDGVVRPPQERNRHGHQITEFSISLPLLKFSQTSAPYQKDGGNAVSTEFVSAVTSHELLL
jgi:hypothetical protein